MNEESETIEEHDIWKLLKKKLPEKGYRPIRLIQVNERVGKKLRIDVEWRKGLLEEEEKCIKELLVSTIDTEKGFRVVEKTESMFKLVVCALFMHEIRRLELSITRTEELDFFLDNIKKLKGQISYDKDVPILSGLPDDWGDYLNTAVPLSSDEWHTLDENEMDDLTSLLPFKIKDRSNLTIIQKLLPFYKEVTNHLKIISGNKTTYAVFLPRGNYLEILDWSSSPIYKINKEAVLRLNEKNTKDYFRFFCNSLASDEGGPFSVIESLDHEKFQGRGQDYIDRAKYIIDVKCGLVDAKDISDTEKEQILGEIKPMVITKKDDKFTSDVCIWYGNILFKTNISVGVDGHVEMTNDIPLMEFPSIGETDWHKNIHYRNYKHIKNSNKFLDDLNEGLEKELYEDITFISSFNLEGLTINKKLIFRNCRFRGPVIFRGTTFNSMVEINNCLLENTLNLEEANFREGLLIKESKVLSGKKVENHTVLGFPVSIYAYMMKASHFLIQNVYSQKGVDFRSISLEGNLTIENLNVEGIFNLNNSSIKGQVFLSSTNLKLPFLIIGYITLQNIKCRTLSVEGIEVKGGFVLRSSYVEQSLFLGSKKIGEVYIPLKVGYSNEDTKNDLDLSGMQVAKNYLWFAGVDVAGDVNLSFVSIGSGLFFTSSDYFPLRNIIGGSLIMGGMEVQKIVSIEGVYVGKSMNARSITTGDLKLLPAITLVDEESQEHTVDTSSATSKIKIQPIIIGEKIDFSFSEITGRVWLIGIVCNNKETNEYLDDSKNSLEVRNANILKNLRFVDFENELQDKLKIQAAKYKVKFKEKFELEDPYEELINGDFNNFKNEFPLGVDLSMSTIGGDLEIANVSCNHGIINLSDSNIGRNCRVQITEDQECQNPVTACALKAVSITCGGEFDLTGLKLKCPEIIDSAKSAENRKDKPKPCFREVGLEKSVDARYATINGVMRIYKLSPLIKNQDQSVINTYAEIPGKLNLEGSQIRRLVISNNSFPLAKGDDINEKKGDVSIILKQSCIETLGVYFNESNNDKTLKNGDLFPRPVDLEFANIKYWDFNDCETKYCGEKGGEAECYINFLNNSKYFYRHTYRAVENTLFNQGHEEAADRVHIAQKRQLRKSESNILKKITNVVWDGLTAHGTSEWRLIILVIVWFFVSTAIFSVRSNISPSELGLAATNATLTSIDIAPESWGILDGLMIAIRYHIPIANLSPRDEWEPTNKRSIVFSKSAVTNTNPSFTPEDYSLFVSALHWIIIPIIVFIFSNRILRRRGSG